MIFKDRIHAGQLLAKKLKKYKNNPQVLVLGMPRGGAVVARKIFKYLNCHQDNSKFKSKKAKPRLQSGRHKSKFKIALYF